MAPKTNLLSILIIFFVIQTNSQYLVRYNWSTNETFNRIWNQIYSSLQTNDTQTTTYSIYTFNITLKSDVIINQTTNINLNELPSDRNITRINLNINCILINQQCDVDIYNQATFILLDSNSTVKLSLYLSSLDI